MSSRVTWKINLFNEAKGLSEKAADEAVRKIAFEIQREAQRNVRSQGAIDTGALLNSAYTDTSRSSGRGGAAAGAVGKSKKVRLAMPSGGLMELGHARVAFAVEYALYVEMGVSNAWGKGIKIGARPFLNPAVESVRAKAEKIAADAFAKEFR